MAGQVVPLSQVVPTALAAGNGSLAFTGSEYVEVLDNGTLWVPFNLTVEAWVKPQSASGYHVIVGKSGYEIAVQQSGSGFLAELQVSVQGTWYTLKSSVQSYGSWYHIAGTYDGSTLRLFVNGNQVASTPLTGNIDPSISSQTGPQLLPLRIGTTVANGDLFVGKISEVRVSSVIRYTGAFTPSTTAFLPDVTTKGLWHLNDGAGSTAADSSGIHNNGNLVGPPTWTTDGPVAPAPVDSTAPTISNVAANPQDVTATITWTTSEPASTYVDFGPTTAYGLNSVPDATLSTSHTVNLGGLTPSSTFNYHVVSADASGNQTVSGNFSFTTTAAPPSAATQGEWGSLMNWPLVSLSMAQLNNGQILMFDGWEMPGTASVREWNVNTGTFMMVPDEWDQIFCSASAALADGRLVVVGGHRGGEWGNWNTAAFDPSINRWVKLADMDFARWYPSATTTADGRIVTISGMTEPGQYADTPEIYNPSNNTWSHINVSTPQLREDQYPLTYQIPNGKLLTISPNTSKAFLFDYNTPSWTQLSGTLPVINGSAVQYRPGKILFTGGGDATVSPDSLPNAMVLDATGATPTWHAIQPMANGRTYHNEVILADGKVLIVGGSDSVSSSPDGPRTSELFDPATETFTTMAAQVDPRMYHSTATLLPDGRVLSAGGGRLPGDLVTVDYLTAQIYSPPYLFKGARPFITAAPTSISYGNNFTISSPDAASVTSVALHKLPSVTHTLDSDSNYVPLSFTVNGNSITVTPPSTSTVATAGQYYLFIMNGQGVPSVAKIMSLGGTSQATQPPAVSITAPANGATVNGTVSVTANATSGVGISSVQFKLDGANLGNADLNAPYSASWNTLAATNGTHTLTATATDSLGQTSTATPVSVTVSNPLQISSVAATNITQTGATITWTTNSNANSEVDYGATTSYGSTATDAAMVTSHSVALGSLTPNSTYHYLAKSTDASNNTVTSTDLTFTTLAVGPVTLVGDTNIEAGVDETGAGAAEAFQYTASASGTVSQLAVYVDATNAATKVVVGLYTDNAGVPGTLLTSGSISNPTKSTFNKVNVSAASVTAGTKYWIAVLGAAGGGNFRFRDVGSGGPASASAETNLTAMPATWTSSGIYANSPMSAYAVQSGPADTTPPTVAMTAPANGATVSGTTVTVSANASDDVAVSSVQFKLDGANLGSADTTSPYSITWNSTGVSNGTHTLGAVATDSSGNTTSATTVSVTVSNTPPPPPTVSITAPTGGTVSGTVTVSANASSSAGVANVQFKLDGANLGSADTTAPYSVSWNTTSATNASHTLTAVATDTTGQATTSAPVSVTVNNPPVISAINVSNITQTSATVTWTTNTASSSEVDYGTTTSYGQVATNASLVTSHSVNLTGLTASTTYHFIVKSTDAANNTVSSTDQNFATAGAGPVTLVGDANTEVNVDETGAGSAEAFQYTATATGSVTQLAVYVDATNAATSVIIGLYADTAGKPGSLLAQGTITNPTKSTFNKVTVTSVNVTSGTKYWIAVLSPSGKGTFRFRDVASGGPAQASSKTTLTALPATWAAGSNWANSPMSAYAAGNVTVGLAPDETFAADDTDSEPATDVFMAANEPATLSAATVGPAISIGETVTWNATAQAGRQPRVLCQVLSVSKFDKNGHNIKLNDDNIKRATALITRERVRGAGNAAQAALLRDSAPASAPAGVVGNLTSVGPLGPADVDLAGDKDVPTADTP